MVKIKSSMYGQDKSVTTLAEQFLNASKQRSVQMLVKVSWTKTIVIYFTIFLVSLTLVVKQHTLQNTEQE